MQLDCCTERPKPLASSLIPSTFGNGERAVFRTELKEYALKSGEECIVIRPLPSETGPMYRVRFADGLEIAAFGYELERIEEAGGEGRNPDRTDQPLWLRFPTYDADQNEVFSGSERGSDAVRGKSSG